MDEQLDFKEMLTDLVDKYFPKNDTAALGGEPSPGRGEAMVIVAWAITHHEALLATEYHRGYDIGFRDGAGMPQLKAAERGVWQAKLSAEYDRGKVEGQWTAFRLLKNQPEGSLKPLIMENLERLEKLKSKGEVK